MLDEENKQKNYEFLNSLVKNPNKNKEFSNNNYNDKEENIDHLLRRTIYNQDLVLNSRAMINKKRYFFDKIYVTSQNNLLYVIQNFQN
jgi:hypothetical protein